ncbi:hypothetical protein BDN72DRAFT_864449 [Pluteus cervinus]|uniref:Uncharacterized protein n=1 Tax=Pluteus cervinus TaxID=181527 RepID=A0ACD3A472_9AGAR|nr:hypothetical protein BDN72DRAFT_864449 [Pluteus cervinus]
MTTIPGCSNVVAANPNPPSNVLTLIWEVRMMVRRTGDVDEDEGEGDDGYYSCIGRGFEAVYAVAVAVVQQIPTRIGIVDVNVIVSANVGVGEVKVVVGVVNVGVDEDENIRIEVEEDDGIYDGSVVEVGSLERVEHEVQNLRNVRMNVVVLGLVDELGFVLVMEEEEGVAVNVDVDEVLIGRN